MNLELNPDELKSVARALLAKNAAYIDAVPEERSEIVSFGGMVAFTALVRDVFTDADDFTITEAAASAAAFGNPEGGPLPVWVAEGAIRYALGQPQAIEGIEPGALFAVYFAFLLSWIDSHPLPMSKIEELAEVGTTKFFEAINDSADQ